MSVSEEEMGSHSNEAVIPQNLTILLKKISPLLDGQGSDFGVPTVSRLANECHSETDTR